MPIPTLENGGWLPPGLHACTIDEVYDRFVAGIRSRQRTRCCDLLRLHLRDPVVLRYVQTVVIDGSFASAKQHPRDVDVLFGLVPGTMDVIKSHSAGSELGDAIAGWKLGRVDGRPIIDAEAWDVGSAVYCNKLQFFQSSSRLDEPAVKGVLLLEVSGHAS